MGRLTKIVGEFMGVKFEVKPTPIRFDKVIEERKQMLFDWYKENHPNVHKKLTSDKYTIDDFTFEELNHVNSWMLDEDFRAKYCKFTADKCMKLAKELPDSVWKSDDLEIGTIEESWDFFTKRRQVPINGVGVL